MVPDGSTQTTYEIYLIMPPGLTTSLQEIQGKRGMLNDPIWGRGIAVSKIQTRHNRTVSSTNKFVEEGEGVGVGLGGAERDLSVIRDSRNISQFQYMDLTWILIQASKNF